MKECKMCGCLIDEHTEGNICECCLDDLHEAINDFKELNRNDKNN